MTFSAIVTPVGTPVLTRATAGSVTGTWGTGGANAQPRTAGNTLVAVVTAGGSTASAAAITTPSGWTLVSVASNTPTTANAWAAVYTKVAAGGDSAPAFTATLTGTVAMTCTLLELMAADNATLLTTIGTFGSPADVQGTYASGASAATLSSMVAAVPAGQVTSVSGEYAFAVFCQEAAAAVNTWNGAGGSWGNLVNDGATSSVLHTAIDVQAGVAAAAALTETGHWTTNTSAFGVAIIIGIAPQSGGYEQFTTEAATTITVGGTTTPVAGTPELWTAASWASFPAASNAAQPQVLFKVADPSAPTETIAVLNTTTGLVIRGVDGTIPVAHATGFTIQGVISAGFLAGAVRRNINVAPPAGVAATDSAAIRAALNAARSSGGGTVIMQPGLYVGDANQFYVPPFTKLELSQGTRWQINCSGGAACDAISVDTGSLIYCDARGTGFQGQIVSTSSVNCRALIANTVKVWPPGQEFFGLDGIAVQAFNGTFAVATLDMRYCFTPSGIKHCIIDGSGTGGTPVPCVNIWNGGPIWFRNCSIGQATGDCMYVSGGTGGLWLDDVEIDTPGNGYHNLNLDGTSSGGAIYNVRCCGLHMERAVAATTGPSAYIKANGVWQLSVDNWAIYCGAAVTNMVGLWITSQDNQNINIRNVQNVNGVSPTIQDDIAGNTMLNTAGHRHIMQYYGPGGASLHAAHTGQMLFDQGDIRLCAQSVALASTAVDAAFGNIIDVAALAAGVTVAAPLNPVANQMLIFKFVQNGTGTYVVAWNAAFRVAAGVVSTTASKASTVAFRYDSTLSAWVQLWASTGV